MHKYSTRTYTPSLNLLKKNWCICAVLSPEGKRWRSPSSCCSWVLFSFSFRNASRRRSVLSSPVGSLPLLCFNLFEVVVSRHSLECAAAGLMQMQRQNLEHGSLSDASLPYFLCLGALSARLLDLCLSVHQMSHDVCSYFFPCVCHCLSHLRTVWGIVERYGMPSYLYTICDMMLLCPLSHKWFSQLTKFSRSDDSLIHQH